MKAIQSTSGTWWTGTCWGAKEARELYEVPGDLPTFIGDPPQDDTELVLADDGEQYILSWDDGSFGASVREVK